MKSKGFFADKGKSGISFGNSKVHLELQKHCQYSFVVMVKGIWVKDIVKSGSNELDSFMFAPFPIGNEIQERRIYCKSSRTVLVGGTGYQYFVKLKFRKQEMRKE